MRFTRANVSTRYLPEVLHERFGGETGAAQGGKVWKPKPLQVRGVYLSTTLVPGPT
jgi:hypothetical protein